MARTVMSINKRGGEPPTSHAPVHRSDPQWVTTDATHIYYANTDEGSVERVPRGNGAMETLVTGQGSVQGSVQGIAVVGHQLFHASSSSGLVARVLWQ